MLRVLHGQTCRQPVGCSQGRLSSIGSSLGWRVCRELADTCLALNTWGLAVARRGLCHCLFEFSVPRSKSNGPPSPITTVAGLGAMTVGLGSQHLPGMASAGSSSSAKTETFPRGCFRSFSSCGFCRQGSPRRGWSLHSLPKGHLPALSHPALPCLSHVPRSVPVSSLHTGSS